MGFFIFIYPVWFWKIPRSQNKVKTVHDPYRTGAQNLPKLDY